MTTEQRTKSLPKWRAHYPDGRYLAVRAATRAEAEAVANKRRPGVEFVSWKCDCGC